MALFDPVIFDAVIFDTGPGGPVGLFATQTVTEGSDSIAVSATLGPPPTASNSLNFGAGNTTRYHTFTGPALNNSGDWSIGLWIRPDAMNAGETGFQYILSNGALGGVDTVNIYLQENNSGASLAAFVANSTAATLINTGVAGAWPKDGTNYFVVLQKRGSNFEIYRVVKGASTATPTTVATTETGTIPSKTFYVGSRSDLNVDRFYENPLGEVFFLTGDSLTNAEVITLAAGAHITAVRTTRAVDLRFREDVVSEPDLSGNGRNTTRFGTGYTLAAEFFPETGGGDLIVTQAVTEGADTHASDVDVRLTVSQTVTENTSDTHSSDVDVRLSVTQTVTENTSDAHASDVDVRATASQSVTENTADTIASSAFVQVISSQTSTEGADTHSADVDVLAIVAQTVTEGSDTTSASAVLPIVADFRRNFVKNSAFVGTVVGAIGSGGVLPNGMSWGSTAGVTREILAVGVDANGFEYMDFRISGTNTSGATNYPDIYFLDGLETSAYVGNQWVWKLGFQVLAGSRTGFVNTNQNLEISEHSSNNGYVSGGGVVMTNGGFTTISRTTSSALTTRMRGFLSFAIANGSTVDYSFRVWAPQFERGLVAGTYIRTTGTSASSIFEDSDTFSGSMVGELAGLIVSQTVTEGADTHSSDVDAIISSSQSSTEDSDTTSGDVDAAIQLFHQRNFIPNSEYSGASVGSNTMGTGFYGLGTLSGVTRSVVGTGVENGRNYVDVRFFGTSTAQHADVIGPTPLAVLPGQSYNYSAYIGLVAGAWPAIAVNLHLVQRNGIGTGLAFDGVDIRSLVTGPTPVRVSRPYTINNISTVNFDTTIRIDPGVGVAVDFTIRVSGIQITGGLDLVDYIPSTSGANSGFAETTSDTISSNASVSILASQSVSETGSDTASSSTSVNQTVNQGATESSDTHSSDVDVFVSANQSSTEGSDTASINIASAGATVTQNAAEGSDTSTASVSVGLITSHASTEGTDTHESTAVSPIFAEPRKNIIRNSEMVNAPILVLTSAGNNVGNPAIGYFGGTGSAGANIVKEIVATGTTGDGYNYIDYRISGTNTHTATVRPDLYLSGLSNPPHYEAYPGQTWTASLGTEVIAGSRTGFESTFNGPRLAEMDVNGNYLLESGSSGSNLPGIKTWTRTLTNANTRRIALYISFGILPGATVDLTLRIYAPMLERGSVAGAYLPTYGSPIGTLPETGSDTYLSNAVVEIQASQTVVEIGSDNHASDVDAQINSSQSSTEGFDTQASAVSVHVNSLHSSTEGADTHIASLATGGVTLTQSSVEGSDTFASNVTVDIAFAQASTEGTDTQASSVAVLVQAAQASTELADAMALQASVSASAAISATEVGDTTSASFQTLVAASMASDEGVDSLSASLSSTIALAQTAVEGLDNHVSTLVSSVDLAQTAVETTSDNHLSIQVVLVLGTQIAQESADLGSSSISVDVSATQVSTEGSDFTEVDTDTIISLSTNATEGSDNHVANIVTTDGWTINATEVGQDTHASSANLRSILAQTAAEQPDTGSASISVSVVSSLNSSEGLDTHSSTIDTVQPSFSLNAAEGQDILVATTRVLAQASQTVAEVGQDTLASVLFAQVRLTQTNTETGQDSTAGSANVRINSSVVAAEQTDTTIASISLFNILSINSTEGNDTLASTIANLINSTVSVSEAGQDSLNGSGSVLVRATQGSTEDSDSHAADGFVTILELFATQDSVELGSDTFTGIIEASTNVEMFVVEGEDVFSGMVSPARQERNLPPILVQMRKFGHYRESSNWSTTIQPRLYGAQTLTRNISTTVNQRKYSATVDK